MLLVLILLLVQMNRVHSQDPQWPVHTVCDSERITVTYRSCGEISVTYTTVQQLGSNYLNVFGLKGLQVEGRPSEWPVTNQQSVGVACPQQRSGRSSACSENSSHCSC